MTHFTYNGLDLNQPPKGTLNKCLQGMDSATYSSVSVLSLSFKTSLLQEMNMMFVPFAWMNMRMEINSEFFLVLMVSSYIGLFSELLFW